MEREMQNAKKLWYNPQITEIEVIMTEGHGQGGANGKNGTLADGQGTEGRVEHYS